MASATTIRKPKSTTTSRRRGVARLRPQNKKLLHWLDSWLAAPEDRSETWWAELESDLKGHTITFRPNQAE